MEKLKNQENFYEHLACEQVMAVLFGSHSCGPCSAISRRMGLWQGEHPHVRCLYVPVEEFPQLCGQLGVFTVPTVLVYVQGKLTLRESGYFSLDQILHGMEKYCRILGMNAAE